MLFVYHLNKSIILLISFENWFEISLLGAAIFRYVCHGHMSNILPMHPNITEIGIISQ